MMIIQIYTTFFFQSTINVQKKKEKTQKIKIHQKNKKRPFSFQTVLQCDAGLDSSEKKGIKPKISRFSFDSRAGVELASVVQSSSALFFLEK